MFQRSHDRAGPGQTRSPRPLSRRGAGAVLALQRMAGNRATTRLVARQKKQGNFEHSVKLGKHTIEIKEGNLEEWTGAKFSAEVLEITTVKGKHSDELKRLSGTKERVDKLVLQSIVGENTMMTVKIGNARIVGYEADASGKTESWKAVDFETVDRERLSIGKHRP